MKGFVGRIEGSVGSGGFGMVLRKASDHSVYKAAVKKK